MYQEESMEECMSLVSRRYPTLAPALALAAVICTVVFIGGVVLGLIPFK